MAEDPKFVVHGSQVQKWTDDIQRLKQERDAYKKQRDELINDMAETESKAKAFDEILDINIDKDELLSEEYIEKVNDVIQEWIFN
ncbi:hypothetical protein K4R20_11135 [Staphylococcus epidermidis]|nr:hypothetical protein [Staphylococcus epidermidis]MCG1213946.1 hypothetical protein [Staphylococcus epidermidis]MCG2017612.1 hypothetical protein [Staphylococcus epidermidis]MCG2027654.1 hypothetical protein [Staphylococcus epidermidis]